MVATARTASAPHARGVIVMARDYEEVDARVLDREPHGVWKRPRKVSWPILIAGIVLIALGIACLIWPEPALETIGVLIGIGLIVSGVLGVADFFMTGGLAIFTGWLLFDGIIGVLLGIFFLCEPLATAAAMSWLIGILVVCGGIAQIVSAFNMHKLGGGVWGFALAAGVLSVLIGIALFVAPASLSILIGMFGILYGAMFVAGAFAIPKVFA